MPKQGTKKDKLYHTGGYMSKSIYVTPQDILNYIAIQMKKRNGNNKSIKQNSI